MKVITQGRARFTVSGAGIDWRDMLKHAEQYHAVPIADPDAYREAMRVAEVNGLLAAQAKTKTRRPTVTRGSRQYPKNGAELSTHDYVLAYFTMNKHTSKGIAGFERLSKRITPIEGEYTERFPGWWKSPDNETTGEQP